MYIVNATAKKINKNMHCCRSFVIRAGKLPWRNDDVSENKYIADCQWIFFFTHTQGFLYEKRYPAFLTWWSFPESLFLFENGLWVRQSHSLSSDVQFINILTGFMIKVLQSVPFQFLLSMYSSSFTNWMCCVFLKKLSWPFPTKIRRAALSMEKMGSN